MPTIAYSDRVLSISAAYAYEDFGYWYRAREKLIRMLSRVRP